MTRRNRWLPGVLRRIHDLAEKRRIEWTDKALDELDSLTLGLEKNDVRDVLMNLNLEDSSGRKISSISGEWMYLFLPLVGGLAVYIKIIIRADCVIISFHEDGL